MKIKDIAREAGRNALQEMKRPQWWGFFVSLAVMALLAMALVLELVGLVLVRQSLDVGLEDDR